MLSIAAWIQKFAFTCTVLVGTFAWSNEVVRMDLSNCQFTGVAHFSGQRIDVGNKAYVISSSWAQMTASQTGCEQVISKTGPIAVKALGTDHLAGLSVYEVLRSTNSDLNRVPLMKVADASAGNAASIAVFGANGAETYAGQIVIARSRRHHIPSWDRVLEWQGAEVSSVAMGAPVFRGNEWIGVVSHEFLQLVPGAQTKVRRWDLANGLPQKHLVVIPAQEVLQWLQTRATRPVEPVVWLPEDQRRGVDRRLVGNLLLSSNCPRSDDPNPGGRYPIGGNDGFGIGGDAGTNKACEIQAQLSPQIQSAWQPVALQTWASKNGSSLQAKNAIAIWYGASAGAEGLTKDYFYSIDSFLKVALAPEKSFIDVQTKQQAPPKLEPLFSAAEALQQESLQCYQKLFIREQNVQELVRKLFFFSLLSQGSSWSLLSSKELDAVTDPKGFYGPAWKDVSWVGICGLKLFERATAFKDEHKRVWPSLK